MRLGGQIEPDTMAEGACPCPDIHAVPLADDGWDGATILRALTHLEAAFSQAAPSISSINVFPVADGDTGANMLATIRAATGSAESARQALDLSSSPIPAKTVLAAAAGGAVDGARGNSGVILSQFFAGLASVPLDGGRLDASALSSGLVAASLAARAALARPVDGTILTVMDAAASAVAHIDAARLTIRDVLDLAVLAACEALTYTTEQLPPLAAAGVVDAGGYGFVILLEALREFAYELEEAEPDDLLGLRHPERSVEDAESRDQPFHRKRSLGYGAVDPSTSDLWSFARDDRINSIGLQSNGVSAADDDAAPERQTYCINFMLSPGDLGADGVRNRLSLLGDSLVVVGAGDRLRVHLHSAEVEQVVAEADALGSISRLQVEEIVERGKPGHSTGQRTRDGLAPSRRQPFLTLACASGDGLERVLREMGATIVVRTDRADFDDDSLKSLLRSFMMSGLEVALLPNDGDFIEPFRDLVEAIDSVALHLLETRSVSQGLAALAAQRTDLETSRNLKPMRAASLTVKTLAVVSSLLRVNGAGEARGAGYLGLIDGETVTQGSDPVAVLLDLVDRSEPDKAELLTIFRGTRAAAELLGRIQPAVGERFPWLSVEVLEGGQANEVLIAALE